jgi:protein-tyrosine phosphatase
LQPCLLQILVHCTAGASRAPSCVMAYLLVCKKISLNDAYAYLSAIRPQVMPNKGFLFQLATLEVLYCTSYQSIYFFVKDSDFNYLIFWGNFVNK